MELNTIIDARFCLVRAKVLALLGEVGEAESEELRGYEKARSIGWSAYRSGSEIHALLKQESTLVAAWEEGKSDAEQQEDFEPAVIGSREEWDALSSAEQDGQWEDFHDRCALGIADDMYFYRVMMNMHLVGYVGH